MSEIAQRLNMSNALYVRQDNMKDTGYARVYFSGVFDEKSVIWDCEFMTLNKSIAKLNYNGNKDFIEIAEEYDGLMPIRVVLRLDNITEPDIKKMIIMVRNYKRLNYGRHIFG